jgi:hypothetical protein
VIGAIGDREHIARLELDSYPGVARVVPILKPYKLASAERVSGGPLVFEIGGRRVGGEHFALIAGPCTVESRDQLLTAADDVLAGGRPMLRGGAYKPARARTPSTAWARPAWTCSPRPRRARACRSSPSSWTRATWSRS